jgi:hypothetical protein
MASLRGRSLGNASAATTLSRGGVSGLIWSAEGIFIFQRPVCGGTCADFALYSLGTTAVARKIAKWGKFMPEGTITLREAASRLARIRNPKGKKIESSRLLNVLRSGQLRAGFYFLHGAAWIEIPLWYWQAIGADRFRGIGRKAGDPKSGTYKIKANEIPEEVARVICTLVAQDEKFSGEHQTKTLQEAVADVVGATAVEHEVTIKTRDFDAHLDSRGLQEHNPAPKVGRGRKEGWRELCSYMAAYFGAHYRDRPAEALKIEQAKVDIINLAKNRVSDLPVADTIKEQISNAIALLERNEFKLKK